MIALIGFTGAGKSTLGAHLSQRCGLPCFDADALFVGRTGVSIADYFARWGEVRFREAEAGLIAEIVRGPGQGVLVTGGGAVLRESTRALLSARCYVVCVQVPFEVTVQRLERMADRPLLKGDDPHDALRRLYENRRGLYDFARLFVDGRDVEAAGKRIVANWLLFQNGWLG